MGERGDPVADFGRLDDPFRRSAGAVVPLLGRVAPTREVSEIVMSQTCSVLRRKKDPVVTVLDVSVDRCAHAVAGADRVRRRQRGLGGWENSHQAL